MYAFKRKKRRRNQFIRPKSWLGPQINQQVQVLKPTQTEESAGGLDKTYATLTTIWAGMRAVSHNKYQRWASIENFDTVSHEFVIRRNAVSALNTSYSSGYSTGYDSIPDLTPLKGNLYLFLEQGSTAKGRMFRVRGTMDIEERREALSVLCEEIEERGTGNPG